MAKIWWVMTTDAGREIRVLAKTMKKALKHGRGQGVIRIETAESLEQR